MASRDDGFFSHVDHGDGIMAITAPMGGQMYLVLGGERAALIDTGMGIGSLYTYVMSLTSLPITVINTHGHPDHAGGNGEFDGCHMHPADRKWFLSMSHEGYRRGDIRKVCPQRQEEFESALLPDGPVPAPIEDETMIDLGGRSLQVSLTPGHTPGSICIFDLKTGSLFAGDTLSGQSVWPYDDYSEPLQIYYNTLVRLQSDFADARCCFIGHQPGRLDFSAVNATQMCVRRILIHDAKGTPVKTFAGCGLLYRYGDCSIIYNPARLF
jgi:hydroxyacylglutathione hydrolase